MNLKIYDRILVAYSGGKDSIACVLDLIDRGVDMRKIEIHHHDIDGHTTDSFMDWPCTPAYCDAFTKHFRLKVYHSWRQGGFLREMMRQNQLTASVQFECPGTSVLGQAGGVRGKPNTRRKFPQVSANLQTRWCSASLKIQVMDVVLANQERFRSGKTLVITGERAQESTARSKYKIFEPHRADLRDGKKYQRYIDHWRPVHAWTEERVWETMERYKILMHPAYRLGWGRLSCMTCIFGSANQWASVQQIDPDRFNRMADLEQEFGCTIHRKKTLAERVQDAKPYVDMNPLLVAASLSEGYSMPITTNNWTLPNGAYGEQNGPS